jgi:hypothetical protein
MAVTLAGFPAGAATVSNKTGVVLVSKGEGFVPVAGHVELAPGGRVMVNPGGLATITYAANCAVHVGSGYRTVQEAAPCAKGTTEIDFTGRMNQQGPPNQQDDANPFVTGALVVGGGALVLSCVFWWCQSDNKPASP